MIPFRVYAATITPIPCPRPWFLSPVTWNDTGAIQLSIQRWVLELSLSLVGFNDTERNLFPVRSHVLCNRVVAYMRETRRQEKRREKEKRIKWKDSRERKKPRGKEERWIHYKRWFREKLEESQLTRRWTLLLLRSTLVFCIRRARSVYIRILSSFVSRFPHFVVLFILPALSFPIQAFLPFPFFFSSYSSSSKGFYSLKAVLYVGRRTERWVFSTFRK